MILRYISPIDNSTGGIMVPRKSAKTQDIVVMYTDRHLTLRQIASLVGMTAAGVAKRLRSAGIPAASGEWVDETCCYCGAGYRITRGRWRRQVRHYCSEQCYHKSRENPAYIQCRQGQNMARQKVSSLFTLEPQHIVHHKDSDNSNNNMSNLAVYASQHDHMTHHHGLGQVEPIWDGADV
jgi:hypothetical protein